jgi:hypothetical protein
MNQEKKDDKKEFNKINPLGLKRANLTDSEYNYYIVDEEQPDIWLPVHKSKKIAAKSSEKIYDGKKVISYCITPIDDVDNRNYEWIMLDGRLHNHDGPAKKTSSVKLTNSSDQILTSSAQPVYYEEEYYILGMRWRDNGPAVARKNGSREWWYKGINYNHAEPNMPSKIYKSLSVQLGDRVGDHEGTVIWHDNKGRIHRDGLPAVITRGSIQCRLVKTNKKYYKHGFIHNQKGTAITYYFHKALANASFITGTVKHYYLLGHHVSKEIYKKYKHDPRLDKFFDFKEKYPIASLDTYDEELKYDHRAVYEELFMHALVLGTDISDVNYAYEFTINSKKNQFGIFQEADKFICCADKFDIYEYLRNSADHINSIKEGMAASIKAVSLMRTGIHDTEEKHNATEAFKANLIKAIEIYQERLLHLIINRRTFYKHPMLSQEFINNNNTIYRYYQTNANPIDNVFLQAILTNIKLSGPYFEGQKTDYADKQ